MIKEICRYTIVNGKLHADEFGEVMLTKDVEKVLRDLEKKIISPLWGEDDENIKSN